MRGPNLQKVEVGRWRCGSSVAVRGATSSHWIRQSNVTEHLHTSRHKLCAKGKGYQPSSDSNFVLSFRSFEGSRHGAITP